MDRKYIDFQLLQDNGKTRIVSVVSVKSGLHLGQIKWFSHWGQYAFFPNQDTIWNPDCLRNIIEAIEIEMRMWKNKNRLS